MNPNAPEAVLPPDQQLLEAGKEYAVLSQHLMEAAAQNILGVTAAAAPRPRAFKGALAVERHELHHGIVVIRDTSDNDAATLGNEIMLRDGGDDQPSIDRTIPVIQVIEYEPDPALNMSTNPFDKVFPVLITYSALTDGTVAVRRMPVRKDGLRIEADGSITCVPDTTKQLPRTNPKLDSAGIAALSDRLASITWEARG